MRIVLQRVASASVTVEGEVVGAVGPGLLALVGVARGDEERDAERLAAKVVRLRLFAGGERGFDLSLAEAGGELLCVSQFTLHGDVRRGNRPSWSEAAPPEEAEPLIESFARHVADAGVRVATGRFGAMMSVALVNDGPVTLVLDSKDFDLPRRRA